MVAFSERNRIIGMAAKSQWSSNVNNTIFDLKNMLSLNFNKKWKFDILNYSENSNDVTLCFEISILGQKLELSPCQILAMLLTKIKTETQNFLQLNEEIIGCVLAVPSYFHDQERKALLIAAGIARLDCHFLIKETTAVAINYSLYKKFPTPINVIFIDFGQSSIQISACTFSEKQLEVIEEVSELIGGRDIDEMLADYIIETFNVCCVNKRDKTACVQLLQEVEELKKKMSSNVEKLPLNSYQSIFMERSEMENICRSLFQKIEQLMELILERSRLNVEEIHSIELVGGSSRIPMVTKLIEKVFRKKPIATMNRDEALARGCLLRSLMSKRRKFFKINEKLFSNEIPLSYNESKDYARVYQVKYYNYLKEVR